MERHRVFAGAQPGPRPELEPGPARDRLERAADRVACQVTGHPVPRGPYGSGGAAPPPGPQRARGAAGGALDAGTRQAIRQVSAGVKPVPGPGRVLQARAFTTGQHVFFRRGACDLVSSGAGAARP